jgi:transposase
MVELTRSVRRLEVVTGEGSRRRWSDAERDRILAEATAPSAVVSVVARRHGMSPQPLFTWLRAARRSAACFLSPCY